DAFLGYREWEEIVNEIDRLEQVTKAEVMRVAKQYFGSNYVSGHRIDEQHDLPSIDKPKIDPLDIDSSKQSEFMKNVGKMPFEPFEPKFLAQGTDFEKRELRPGLTLYHATNPINDLGAIEVRFDKGYRHDNQLPYAKRMVSRSGVDELSSEQLKIEWYKMGIDFAFNVSERESSLSVAGLDENLLTGLKLGRKLLAGPTIGQNTLDELIKIILSEREDEPKSPQILAHALAHFHRYGERSRFRDRLTDGDLNASTVENLSTALLNLLATEQSVLYVGPRSLDEIADILTKEYESVGKLSAPPSYEPLRSASPEKTQILFLQKEMAQAFVRIEFAVGLHDEPSRPSSQLFNEYFGGSMAGLVFQELREARALAYSAWGHYFPASRPEDENIVVGFIGCQADKTIEAVKTFLRLMEEMPLEQTRFDSARKALESSYRTSNVPFRAVPSIILEWKHLGLEGDPRKERFPIIQKATLDTLESFYEGNVQKKPKLISIVGDASKIDLETLAKFGEITTVEADDIFSE
ncbi:MAG: insulinase family protein, partial [Opitutales bacterium]